MEKLYTVEDIAQMTMLTSRTIRNYLKNGTLKGRKIGGQWRFTQEDVERFMDSDSVARELSSDSRQAVIDFIDGTNTDIKGEAQACSIIDLYLPNEEAKKKADAVIAFINGDDTKDYVRFTYEYVEDEGKGRFVLFATPLYMVKAIQAIS